MQAKSAKELDDKWKGESWFSSSRKPTHPSEAPNLRLRRALSWLDRAEKEDARGDADAAFIFHWIAFNAMYTSSDGDDKRNRNDFLKKVVETKNSNRHSVHAELRPVEVDAIYDTIYANLGDEIETILDSEFVYRTYWRFRNGDQTRANWKKDLQKDSEKTARTIREGRTEQALDDLFDRLYVLRNQLLHGCATWRGSKNREQVETGAKIMAALVPHFIEAMIDNPKADWGVPSFPVLPE